jgi:hypothetical protein
MFPWTLNRHERKMLADIDKFGCQVLTVFDPDGLKPSFAYSIGFTRTVGQGEVIVFGLNHDLMASMVNETLAQCRDGLELGDGKRISGLLEGFDTIARKIPPENIKLENFNSAIWFHRREFRSELALAYQIVWPGAQQGLFPWEDGCDPYVIDMQPPLYEQGTIH